MIFVILSIYSKVLYNAIGLDGEVWYTCQFYLPLICNSIGNSEIYIYIF